jgi:hypothetical protein
MAAELELVVSAVTGALAGGAVKPLIAPADALADYWKKKISARLARVQRQVSDKRRSGDASVNERVAYRVLMEAAFTDDDIISNYLAGVIAGSSPESDAGIPVLAEIGRLSSFQLRIHFVLYRALWRHGSPIGGPLFLPKSQLEQTFGGEVFDDLAPRLLEAGHWLRREDLLIQGRQWDGYGNDDSFRIVSCGDVVIRKQGERGETSVFRPAEAGLLFTGTEHGLNLLRWACGCPDREMLFRGDLPAGTPPIPACDAFAPIDLPQVPFEEWWAEREALRKRRYPSPGRPSD